MSLESTELKGKKISASERMKTNLEKIQSLKETVDEDVKWLEKEVNSLSSYLKTYSRIKGDVLGALHARRLRTRKLFTMSLAISVSSLTLSLRSSHMAGMKDAMPWVTGLGAASLAFSLFYLRDFLLSFKDPCSKWKAIEADVSNVPQRPEPNEDIIKHMRVNHPTLDTNISELRETSIDREELEILQTKRSMSY